jgi:dTDP-glucose 4,6-dehydratase
MKLLVPGGAGFIGSTFVRLAASQGHETVVLDALTYRGRRDNLSDVEHRFIEGDICSVETLDSVLEHQFDAVVNFANGSFVDRSIKNPDEFVHTNVLGTATLVEAVRRNRVPKLLHISTDEVYGSIEAPGAFTTEHRLDPSSPYSATKAAGDVYALASFKTYGTPVVLARMCNIFGPRQFPENLIPRFVTQLLQHQPVGLYGDGLAIREWMWVEDACHGLLQVLERGRDGETYHLGSGFEINNLQLTKQLIELCGATEDAITYVADRPGHDRRYRLDCSKTMKELGWQATSDFDSRLAETVDWYRQNRPWWENAAPPKSD